MLEMILAYCFLLVTLELNWNYQSQSVWPVMVLKVWDTLIIHSSMACDHTNLKIICRLKIFKSKRVKPYCI